VELYLQPFRSFYPALRQLKSTAVYEQLSERRNIIVIADEAHRTQYGFEASLKDIVDKESKEVIGQRIAYGFAKYMRDALA
jgi:type I restriction enzyme, R subunit